MNRLLLLLFLFLSACSQSYRLVNTEQSDWPAFFSQIKPGDPITITLKDGNIMAGSFFEFKESLVTLQIGHFFRDTEISKIEKIEFKTEGKGLKATVIILMALTGGYIIYTFIQHQ